MFAQAPAPAEPPGTESTAEPAKAIRPGGERGMLRDQEFILWSLAFAGVLLLAAVVFFFFDRWRKRTVTDSPRDLSFSLNSFRQMYENGEITEAEFEKLKTRWASKLKEKVGVAAPAHPQPPPTPAPPPESPPAP
ncbi:MAG: hypothetical protein MUF18_08060 [Fimbriiglobus sp.]|jgi:uncharacterized membrane protein|nr:hypothetical protein [Fimbriiglobus sp.]